RQADAVGVVDRAGKLKVDTVGKGRSSDLLWVDRAGSYGIEVADIDGRDSIAGGRVVDADAGLAVGDRVAVVVGVGEPVVDVDDNTITLGKNASNNHPVVAGYS